MKTGKTFIRELRTKPDFDKTVQRFEAWWVGEVVDRALTSVSVRSNRPYKGPQSAHKTLRDRWLDAEFAVDSSVAWIEMQTYCGDSFPAYWPNVGPEITSTLYGCDLEFSEGTSWSRPVVHRPEDWERVWNMQPDFENVYWKTIERMTDYAIEICDNRFVVGLTDIHGNYDILAGLRDPQELCTDLMDCPELVRRAGQHVSRGYVEAFNRSYRKTSEAGFGPATWCQPYHEGPAYAPSSDFWCMVSPRIAREMILPDILVEMEPLERSLFHLDGPQALPHLDLLLEMPKLNAVQWVFGSGNGPAFRWIDTYRRIRAAGKGVQVLAEDAADALNVLRALGPKGVWLSVGQPFGSVGEAEAFLKEVGKAR